MTKTTRGKKSAEEGSERKLETAKLSQTFMEMVRFIRDRYRDAEGRKLTIDEVVDLFGGPGVAAKHQELLNEYVKSHKH